MIGKETLEKPMQSQNYVFTLSFILARNKLDLFMLETSIEVALKCASTSLNLRTNLRFPLQKIINLSKNMR